ncbi:MAG: hypothetical protein JO320_05145 [Alphaproteobacteria bacterium]|nr:hypothetical protein [Alphaproteobacteria bacterium]MBV9374431.1 hypothetical protein [Alphaproteobacteria bacterium]MBV9815956.1 hypothetical protein [Alphaproteobacteria bacterium]
MASLLKSSVLSLGLLAGAVAAAQAQSVSALPPTSGAPTAYPAPVTSATQGVFPKPGGNSVWQEEHYQPSASYDADKTQHPYSTSIGPKPGSHSSGQDEHYQSTEQDASPARHPYTGGMGPKPGG